VSVINQMLKDLDQRAPEQGQSPVPTLSDQKPSTVKIVFISIVVLLSLNALGLYIWNLQEQISKNFVLPNKAQQIQKTESPVKKQPVAKSSVKLTGQVADNAQETTVQLSVEANEAVNKVQPTQATIKKTLVAQQVMSPVIENKETALKVAKIATPVIVPEIINTPVVVKMSVSRRQLTPKELVSQKLISAEKSVNLNEITKAEQLFEEILIIEPAHKQARKKLAALWFGRKSYQQALNLLSQGIAIDRQDGELRLLKARIHLSHGQHEAAYTTLKPLASFEHEEYQLTLANVAQQIEQYSSAISAYQVLINMQPYSGRWHLGLAIVYDKNSEFSLAVSEYALALTKTDLSASSAKFAQQRMQALGE